MRGRRGSPESPPVIARSGATKQSRRTQATADQGTDRATQDHAVDQRDLFPSRSSLDLFLASDCIIHFDKFVEVHHLVDIVSAGEGLECSRTVFANAPEQVIGYPGVQHSLPVIGQDVDEVSVRHWRELASSLRSSQ